MVPTGQGALVLTRSEVVDHETPFWKKCSFGRREKRRRERGPDTARHVEHPLFEGGGREGGGYRVEETRKLFVGPMRE